MDSAIAAVVVAAALFFVVRNVWRSFKSARDKSAGCANCDAAQHSSSDWTR